MNQMNIKGICLIVFTSLSFGKIHCEVMDPVQEHHLRFMQLTMLNGVFTELQSRAKSDQLRDATTETFAILAATEFSVSYLIYIESMSNKFNAWLFRPEKDAVSIKFSIEAGKQQELLKQASLIIRNHAEGLPIFPLRDENEKADLVVKVFFTQGRVAKEETYIGSNDDAMPKILRDIIKVLEDAHKRVE